MNHSNRIEYLDVLKGWAMLMVVMGHVTIFGYDIGTSPIIYMLCSFHVDLFIFLSGFCAYSVTKRWGGLRTFFQEIGRKIRTLLIPTIIISTLYVAFYIHQPLDDFLSSPMKSGYWFTIVLFEIFIIYYGICQISYIVNKKVDTRGWSISLIIFAVIIFLGCYPFKLSPRLNDAVRILSFKPLSIHFQFFVFGVLYAKYKQAADSFVDKTIGGIIVLFLSLWYIKVFYLYAQETTIVDIWKLLNSVTKILLGYTGLLIAYTFVRQNPCLVSHDTIIGRTLQKIGRHTLEIYLLHWFFIPELPRLGQFFEKTSNLIVELTTSLILSLLIIACCLFISRVLRASDILAYWLLGAKRSESK